jgi:hypothetical protein
LADLERKISIPLTCKYMSNRSSQPLYARRRIKSLISSAFLENLCFQQIGRTTEINLNNYRFYLFHANLVVSVAPLISTFAFLNPLGTLISGFRHDVDDICALLGYYATSCGNCLPTFRDNVSVPSSRVKSPSRKGLLTREDGTDTLSRNVGK